MRIAATLLILCALASAQDGDKIMSNSYKGKAPPELSISLDNWINAKAEVKLANLKGRVIWLEFGYIT